MRRIKKKVHIIKGHLENAKNNRKAITEKVNFDPLWAVFDKKDELRSLNRKNEEAKKQILLIQKEMALLKEEIKHEPKTIFLTQTLLDSDLPPEKFSSKDSLSKPGSIKLKKEVKNMRHQSLSSLIINKRIILEKLTNEIKLLNEAIPKFKQEIISSEKLAREAEHFREEISFLKPLYNDARREVFLSEMRLIEKVRAARYIKNASGATQISKNLFQSVVVSGIVSLFIAVFLAQFLEFRYNAVGSAKKNTLLG